MRARPALDAIRRRVRRRGLDIVRVPVWERGDHPADYEPEVVETLEAVAPYTMTRGARIHALVKAVEYVAAHRVPGAVVECGVWRGGSMMAVARTLLRLQAVDRELFLFDTFTGMSAPTPHDRDFRGIDAAGKFEQLRMGPDSAAWCLADESDVRANMESTGYPADRVHFVRGRVEDTVPGAAPGEIALLRLDTDWYESTRHELEHLYPRLARGGVLILDDYGHWEGVRKATDEYFAARGGLPLLTRVDHACRVAVKP